MPFEDAEDDERARLDIPDVRFERVEKAEAHDIGRRPLKSDDLVDSALLDLHGDLSLAVSDVLVVSGLPVAVSEPSAAGGVNCWVIWLC